MPYDSVNLILAQTSRNFGALSHSESLSLGYLHSNYAHTPQQHSPYSTQPPTSPPPAPSIPASEPRTASSEERWTQKIRTGTRRRARLFESEFPAKSGVCARMKLCGMRRWLRSELREKDLKRGRALGNLGGEERICRVGKCGEACLMDGEELEECFQPSSLVSVWEEKRVEGE
ncbi:hypothetical protein CC78DRAFT_575296 [Lojkania enalia]|uniref:Uncharacterized protein n=1 Tax=Lojkania enalia TaxID=147567 RepID=A0A9P4N9P5_9PLEO|nr:hypothetical protein CC78DRAFT_575296 [Didymosphaeria enalia]